MARMLQALKNLEAKSTAKSAPKPKTPTSPPAVHLAPPSPIQPAAAPPIEPTVSAPTPAVTESIDALAGHLASLDIAIPDPPGRFEWDRGAGTPLAPTAAKPATEWIAKSPAAPAPSSRTTCEIERLVRRTLSDPARAKSLTALAARLRQDLQQIAAKTVAFTGIGQSGTHEAALYAATLLAEQIGGKSLLVDGDLNRRTLTDALEYGRDRGLSELLEDALSLPDVCQPTAVEKLMFLPAGVSQRLDAAAGERWAKLLTQLTTAFDCALIDAGRASESAASTLARTADATYLVVQLGTVAISEAQQALADLRAAGARVLGCIAT